MRKLGLALLGLGGLLLAWVGVTLLWGDPLTSLYTRHEQHKLAQKLDEVDRQWAEDHRPASTAVSHAESDAVALRRSAAEFRRSLGEGQPLGRIAIKRLGLKMVVVQGTSAADLEKGPGHYDSRSGQNTGLPGMGGVIGIAGHRTTYLHPFLHIDDLRSGDRIVLKMPYGRFVYTVYYHKVVSSNDWSILRHRPYEKLVLSACHPLHSATHRWVVFARLTASSAAV
jgi:sortase A